MFLLQVTPDSDCVVCSDVPKCPACASGSSCVLTVRTCNQCPVAFCNSTTSTPSPNVDNGNSKIIPGVICGILGLMVLAAAGYYLYKRKYQSKGIKLDNSEEVSSVYAENVIPIAYIPPSLTPQDAHSRMRTSIVSAGTTPLSSPLPKNSTSETLIEFVEDDDDPISEVGTILQATKTTPTTTVITATRAKPAIVQLNLIKSNGNSSDSSKSSSQSTYSGTSGPNTPKTAKSFLSTPSIASTPGSPTKPGTDAGSNNILPSIDIERPSTESTRPQIQEISQQHHLTSPSQDQIEGRQSFGLFGSDEVYDKEPKSPELQRESVVSSTSTNARSTMLSDEGEIMIFWGGDEPPFSTVTQNKSSENKADAEKNSEVEIKKEEI
ncbi:10227_t:CDS:1 [Cetraspora pellucida]|uniref:10227_t:CDS:1 n=1 Tax=Cetraspora pellucida TaxID=1433469 RepID=A0A9N8ZNI2_9GLOM|nr:10227_t:CDS:1 [Cetraspora pellucida]